MCTLCEVNCSSNHICIYMTKKENVYKYSSSMASTCMYVFSSIACQEEKQRNRLFKLVSLQKLFCFHFIFSDTQNKKKVWDKTILHPIKALVVLYKLQLFPIHFRILPLAPFTPRALLFLIFSLLSSCDGSCRFLFLLLFLIPFTSFPV